MKTTLRKCGLVGSGSTSIWLADQPNWPSNPAGRVVHWLDHQLKITRLKPSTNRPKKRSSEKVPENTHKSWIVNFLDSLSLLSEKKTIPETCISTLSRFADDQQTSTGVVAPTSVLRSSLRAEIRIMVRGASGGGEFDSFTKTYTGLCGLSNGNSHM